MTPIAEILLKGRVLAAFIAVFLFSIPIVSQEADRPRAIDPLEKIHQGDVIEIDELGGFDFDWRGKLTPEGFLDGFTKVADPIYARCRTPEQLAADVTKAYSAVLRNPSVKVRILDKSSRAMAFVYGAVRQPLRFQIKRPVSLRELLIISGGLTDRASGDISVYRPDAVSCEGLTDDPSRVLNIKVADIISGVAAADPRILSGDIVTVEEVRPVYVIGGVERPGKADWRDGLTVSRAVAAVGGVTRKGVAGKAAIYRRSDGTPQIIEVDLDRIVSGDAKDVPLKPYDIVDVPLRGSAKRLLPPVVDDPDIRPTAGSSLPLRIID
ncbi:MAG: polysaccharide biosynthesis/export family protein [Pyrinomonadaceae bacterium]